MAKRTLRSRGRGKAMKLRESAIEHFGCSVDVAPQYLLSHRVVPDGDAERVEQELKGLHQLEQVLEWRSDNSEDDEEFTSLPDKLRDGIKHSTALQLITLWVELGCIEAVLAEIGEEFNGIDPLKPVFRDKLEAAREKLLSVQTWLRVVNIEVELRRPLVEELQEIRDFVASIPNP